MRLGHLSARGIIARATSYTWCLVLLLGVWECGARTSPSLFMPPISEIGLTFFRRWFSLDPAHLFVSDLFLQHAVPSLGRAAEGWAAAAIVGVAVGIGLGLSRVASALLDPTVRFGMSIPSTALMPIAIVVFGVTDAMGVFLIFIGSVWSVLVNTMDGVRSLDPTMVRTARTLRLGALREFVYVVLPGASPQIFAGLRVSLGIALILMVVSELYAATSGIGYDIVYHQRVFRYREMWSGIVLVGVVGVTANALFALAEARLLRWHREMSRGAAMAS